MEAKNQKKEARALALAARKHLSTEYRAAASETICSRIRSLDEYQSARVILSYVPAQTEVDVTALNSAILEDGKTLAFPVSASHGIMEAYAPNGSPLVPGLFGICEPDVAQSALILPEQCDLVIVPMVGFDDELNRLGHGGGYYDRYLARCNHAVKLGVAFEAQRLESVYAEEEDVCMDIIVTEA